MAERSKIRAAAVGVSGVVRRRARDGWKLISNARGGRGGRGTRILTFEYDPDSEVIRDEAMNDA
jgi:hypothetical protein